MASVVAAPPNANQLGYKKLSLFRNQDSDQHHKDSNGHNLEGLGGSLYSGENNGDNILSEYKPTVNVPGKGESEKREIPMSFGLTNLRPDVSNPKEQVWTALARLESNST